MHIGIDLGTSYSLAARMDTDGVPILIPDAGDPELFHTPSVAIVAAGSAYVGSVAEALLEDDPTLKAIRFFKRNLGIREPVYYDDLGSEWYPEALSALILSKLRFDAESEASAEVTGAVITIPAHFSDPQRKAVAAAAMLADLPLLDLVEEPVAAALHYGVANEAHNQVILAYDFGGGTFDATTLSLDKRGIYVLSKSGLTNLGGKELDEKVGEMILSQFKNALGSEPDLSARGLLELRRVSEEIKIELCTPGTNSLRRNVLLGSEIVEVEVHRKDFMGSISAYLEQTLEVTERCLKESGLGQKDINTVLLVGGSSLVPAIPERLKRMFCQEGQKVLYHEPSRAVAFGAAMRAAQKSGQAEEFHLPPELKGVTGFNVGVRTIEPASLRVSIDPLIKKNMPLPTSMRKTYFTTSQLQDYMNLDFVQYRIDESDAVSLGQLKVGPLPNPRPNYPIDVEVDYHEDGTVAVVATDPSTGTELQQSFGGAAGDDIEYLSHQRDLLHTVLIRRP